MVYCSLLLGLMTAISAQEDFALRTQLAPLLNRIDQHWLYSPTDQAVNLMVQGYINQDPHARVLTSNQNNALERVTQGQRGGIGVMLQPDPTGAMVEQVISGMPAERAGIKVGDVITQVDHITLQGPQAYIQAQNLLEGAIDSSVTVHINRPQGPLDITITRQALVDYEACYQRIGNVGVITINFFDAPTHDHMVHAITSMNKDQTPCVAYVLDIRDAYGGLLSSALQAACIWIPYQSAIAKITQKDKKTVTHRNTTQPLIPVTTPVIIIMNEQTASAAELFACALKEQASAITLGSATFGKATIQSVIRLSSYCTVKITTGMIKSGKGSSWERTGLRPDIPLKLLAGSEGRLLIANALDALIGAGSSIPNRSTLTRQLTKRLPGSAPERSCGGSR